MFNFAELVFPHSSKARGKVTEMINKAIIHYRDDLDLQNLIDFGQMEVRTQSRYRLDVTYYRSSSFIIMNLRVMVAFLVAVHTGS